MYEIFEGIVSSFHDRYTEKMDELTQQHRSDRGELVRLRENYERLLLRTGFKREIVMTTFEKKRMKDVRKIVKSYRREKYEYMMGYN